MAIDSGYKIAVLTGKPGEDGENLRIQYSKDNSSWHDTFADGDLYMHTSTDGKTWSGGMRIVGENGQRGGRDLSITTAPGAYTTKVGTFTPAYRLAISTVKTQSGIDTVYVGDTLVYGVYRYPIGYVDATYAYTSARTSVKGDKGDTGFSSRTIAYRVNYDKFDHTNSGELYVCGYNDDGNQADVAGYVIVNGNTHYVKGMLNSNVPMNGFLAVQTGGTSSAPKAPVYAIHDWQNNKFYTITNGLSISGKKWNELFTEITNTSEYIVLGKVANTAAEGIIDFEETTPCLLSSIITDEVNFTYQGVVATTTDMNTIITPYKFTQNENSKWIPNKLSEKTARKWAVVLCMNAATPTSTTAEPVIKFFNGTWWQEISSSSSYYSSLQSMMAGDLPALAGYYDSLGLSVPSICGTYIKTLTSNKAFINELMANDIVVGNKIRSSNNNFSLDKDGKAVLKDAQVSGEITASKLTLANSTTIPQSNVSGLSDSLSKKADSSTVSALTTTVNSKASSASVNNIINGTTKITANITTGSATDTGVAISGGGWTDPDSTTGFGIMKNGDVYANNGEFRGIIGKKVPLNYNVIDEASGWKYFINIPYDYFAGKRNFSIKLYRKSSYGSPGGSVKSTTILGDFIISSEEISTSSGDSHRTYINGIIYEDSLLVENHEIMTYANTFITYPTFTFYSSVPAAEIEFFAIIQLLADFE